MELCNAVVDKNVKRLYFHDDDDEKENKNMKKLFRYNRYFFTIVIYKMK